MTQPTEDQLIAAIGEDRLIGPKELSPMIGRAATTIVVDHSRNPSSLPPVFTLPGKRRLLWRLADVRTWIQAHAKLQAQQRAAKAEAAAAAGRRAGAAR